MAGYVTNPRVGFYQWAGEPPTGDSRDLLTIAREQVTSIGAGLLRFYLGARFDYVYPVLDPRRFGRLARREPHYVIRLPHYLQVLKDPNIRTVVLTVYPARDYGAGYDDLRLARPLTARDLQTEYRQIYLLSDWLLRQFGGQEKTFILSNSEADDRLLDIIRYTGEPQLAIDNLICWQKARYQAVVDARARYPASRLRLLNAFEISLLHLKIKQEGSRTFKAPDGQWNVLEQVVPKVDFDLLAYSAYESTNSPYETQVINTPAESVYHRLRRDLQELRQRVQRPVMIGELGFARELFEGLPTGGVRERLRWALKALEEERPEYVVFWQVLDMPKSWPVRGWGLLAGSAELREELVGFVRRFR